MSGALGTLIKQNRKAQGLSQEILAREIGVSKVAVCWYESGDRTPTLENFKKIIDILNLDANVALGREIDVVSDNEVKYSVKLAKQDIVIIKELQKRPKLYKALYEEPERTIELIDRRMK